MNQLQKITKRYYGGDLEEEGDEKGTGGFWDLAGEMADELVSDLKGRVANYTSQELAEQLQTGFYQVFQKLLVKGETYE